jgi:hypothetical protein
MTELSDAFNTLTADTRAFTVYDMLALCDPALTVTYDTLPDITGAANVGMSSPDTFISALSLVVEVALDDSLNAVCPILLASCVKDTVKVPDPGVVAVLTNAPAESYTFMPAVEADV